jgi:predicted acylesterase/phospholipase RssA
MTGEERDENLKEKVASQPVTVVKHLVLSGGGPSLFSIFGALRELHGVRWHIDNIETIYACSSGSWLAVCIALMKIGLTFDELSNYIVKRNWSSLLFDNMLDMRSALASRGLFDESTIQQSISPLLRTVGLPEAITLNEFCEQCGVRVIMMSVDINTRPLTKVFLDQQSFGSQQIAKLLSTSMALPGLVTPWYNGEQCLIDGGLMSNYPFLECLEKERTTSESILGFKIKWTDRDLRSSNSANFIEYLLHLVKMMALHIDRIENIIPLNEQTVDCEAPDLGGPSGWLGAFGDPDCRSAFIEEGKRSATKFIETHQGSCSQTVPVCHT